jgi:hypothetical protein
MRGKTNLAASVAARLLTRAARTEADAGILSSMSRRPEGARP